jgi:DNA-binding transcriptional regulator LsrR (DeoR family)
MIENKYRWLKNAQVVHTAGIRVVAQRGAEVLLNLVSRYVQRSRPRKTVRVGFAGGRSVGLLAREFATLLCREKIDLPDTIVLQSLVAGFDPTDPATDPNTFFSFFMDESSIRVKTEFIALHAPPMVHPHDIESLRHLPEIHDAYEAARQVDIIVTSGAEWKDEHSLLRRSMARERDVYHELNDLGCVGDILWRPIGTEGPISEETAIRAMTLIELDALPALIKRGTKVILMLGPCGKCRRPKGHLLKTIMDYEQQLVTHLVTDTRTAVDILR